MFMPSASDRGIGLLAVLYIGYQIGVPIMGLYFLYVHATRDADGFLGFIGYMFLASIEALIWPLAVFWVG